MTRGISCDPHHIYVRPRPEVVAQVWDWSSPEAACERWFWLPHSQLAKLASEGRQAMRRRSGAPTRTSAARSTTPERDVQVIETVARLCSVWQAAQETGLSLAIVYRILRENDVQAPKADRTLAANRAAETRRRRAAA